MSPTAMLALLAVNALFALVGAAALLLLAAGPPQLAAHLAFALGVLPLILAAIAYFIPVLTRSGGAPTLRPALAGWLGGVVAASAFATDFSMGRLHAAAGLAAAAAIGLGLFIRRRLGVMLGPRHPGVDWYLAALACLLAAMAAVFAMPVLPAQRSALRLFHLHANLLGFVGLTAIGTLQVLLPTCAGGGDPDAVGRLRRDLRWSLGGTAAIAVGTAWWPPLAWLGSLCYVVPVLRMLDAWRRRYGAALVQAHGATPSLVAATVGLCLLLILHGGGAPGRPTLLGFVVAFLLPLVSGAAGQLLPVWLRPGAQGDWHRRWRGRFLYAAGVRALILLLLGMFFAARGLVR